MKQFFFLTGLILLPASLFSQVAIRGEMVYRVSKPPVSNGVVLVNNGKIEQVGPADSVSIPAGYKVISGKVVTPGFIDARTVVGLTGVLNQPHDQDQLDLTSAIQPELRAVDAYNPKDELVKWLQSFGVTTIHTGHAPGALISGQTFIVKTLGESADGDLIDQETMQAITVGKGPSRHFQSPGTRAKAIAMLRADLIKAREYREKKATKDPSKYPATDLRLESLSRLLSREDKALIYANSQADIQSAIRLAQEFNLDLVLDGAAEAWKMIPELRKAGCPVLLQPSMVRTMGDLKNSTFESARMLAEASVPFAFQSGYEEYVPKTRVVLFEAGLYAANGLGLERTLKALTLDAATILGIGHRTGSLDPGKDADVVVLTGDPFEYTTRVCTVLINGRIVSQTCY
ncbi:MAG: amidohydrolase family protein [Bacteroidetes bacterium]|nr:amidohydrolase family protein [Bacteroidota bacterium]